MTQFRIKVKGIIKNNDNYLLVKQWFDDNINNPYQWGFIDEDLKFGDNPDDLVLTAIEEKTGIHAEIDNILYTWTYVVGEVQYIGLAYLCDAQNDIVILSEDLNGYEWVHKEDLDIYIENKEMLQDVVKALQ